MSQLNEKQAFSALAITREFVPPAAIQCQYEIAPRRHALSDPLSTGGELLSRVLVRPVASLGCSAGVGQCAGQHRPPGGLGTTASSALRSLWCVEQLQHYCSYLSAAGLTHPPHTPQPREATSTELLTPWRDITKSTQGSGAVRSVLSRLVLQRTAVWSEGLGGGQSSRGTPLCRVALKHTHTYTHAYTLGRA
ncbi:hypothetical protein MHYP_G00134630 [Metynnis hypsauchen]